MAKPAGKGQNAKRKSRRLNYFYLNGKLHKTIKINRPADIISAWSYPEHKLVGYTYSDVKRRHGKAFSTAEVSKMLNRSVHTLKMTIARGHIEAPQKTYSLSEKGAPYKYMWSEQDVMNIHEYLSSLHYGRPRNDGISIPLPMPNAREIRALMRQDELLFIKHGEEFVPVWEAF